MLDFATLVKVAKAELPQSFCEDLQAPIVQGEASGSRELLYCGYGNRHVVDDFLLIDSVSGQDVLTIAGGCGPCDVQYVHDRETGFVYVVISIQETTKQIFATKIGTMPKNATMTKGRSCRSFLF